MYLQASLEREHTRRGPQDVTQTWCRRIACANTPEYTQTCNKHSFPKACNRMPNGSYNIWSVHCQRLFHYWEWQPNLMIVSKSLPISSWYLQHNCAPGHSNLVLAKMVHAWYQYCAYHPSCYDHPKQTLPDLPQLLPPRRIFWPHKVFDVIVLLVSRWHECQLEVHLDQWKRMLGSTLHPPLDIPIIALKTRIVGVWSLNSIATIESFLPRSILVCRHPQAPPQ